MTWENEGSSIGYSALQSPLFIHLCLSCLASCLPSCLPKSDALQLRSSAGGEARCGRSAEVEVWRGRVGGGEEGRGAGALDPMHLPLMNLPRCQPLGGARGRWLGTAREGAFQRHGHRIMHLITRP